MAGDKRIWVGMTRDTTVNEDHVFRYIDVDDHNGREIAMIKDSDDESDFTSDELFVNWGDGEPNNNGGHEDYVEFKKINGTYTFNDLPETTGHNSEGGEIYALCEERNRDCFKGVSFVICAFCQTL